MTDLYAVLGVARTATSSEIKSAFRKLAKKNHPDVGGDPLEFKKIEQAYGVLCDEARRAEYDRTGEIPIRAADNGHVKIMMRLDYVFGMAIGFAGGDEWQRADIVGIMKKVVASQRQERAENRKKVLKMQGDYKKLLGRFKKKSGAGEGNLLEAIVRSKVDWGDRTLQEMAEVEELDKAIAALLKDYMFDVEFLLQITDEFQRERTAKPARNFPYFSAS